MRTTLQSQAEAVHTSWWNGRKGSKIILESNEDYYKGAPAIKHIELRVLKEATTAMVALESGMWIWCTI